MARGRGRSGKDLGEWVQKLGEQIGVELGQLIAQTVQKTLERNIDPTAVARRLGAGIGRRSRARDTCTEAGCDNPVLARGLCRSHYYRARYRAQKKGRKNDGAAP